MNLAMRTEPVTAIPAATSTAIASASVKASLEEFAKLPTTSTGSVEAICDAAPTESLAAAAISGVNPDTDLVHPSTIHCVDYGAYDGHTEGACYQTCYGRSLQRLSRYWPLGLLP